MWLTKGWRMNVPTGTLQNTLQELMHLRKNCLTLMQRSGNGKVHADRYPARL